MTKIENYHIDVEIDKLTNSVVNRISGDSFSTDVHHLEKADFKNISKTKGWLFNWTSESKLVDRDVYKLTIRNNPSIVQGLMSMSDVADHFYLHLIENAPFNLGTNKIYEGVPGNLFAFACKRSWDKGYQGFVAFTAKTKLVEHYEKIIGATHIGGNKMIIFPKEALKLIQKYYPS